MKRILIAVSCLLAACGAPQTGEAPVEPKPASNEPAEAPTTTVVIDTNDVAKFRGTTMAQLLKTMEDPDEGRWHYVRRHVVPKPLPPVEERDGVVVKVNYDWPPRDTNKLTAQQKAWRSYLLWPEHVRELLSGKNWSEDATRDRLSRIGRAYELTWKFHQAPEFKSQVLESEHWRTYAESMLAYGDDGRSLLVSNMILALTNPSEDVIANAKSVLLFVGEPAIEQLCAAMWIGHRQRAVLDSGEYYVQTNADFNRHVMETLFSIGPRSLPRAVHELENSLDKNGKATGTAWRFRRYFVELIGRFGSAEYLRTLEAEIDRVEVIEYNSTELAKGRQVVDAEATEYGRFVFEGYLIQALGGIRGGESLRGIIKLWEKDPDHENSAIDAIRRCTGERDVRSIAAAKKLAQRLNVKLDAE